MKNIAFTLILFLLSSVTVHPQSIDKSHPFPKTLECKTCHACEIPTKTNPCLYYCPRENMITIHHTPEEGPDIISINKFAPEEDSYEPVTFTHRLHAEMSGMAGGCSLCHHYNPPGAVLGCTECHETSRKRKDISKPDLKGAYHRQCMYCHREWGHSVECESCHSLKGALTKETLAKADIKDPKRVHPVIVEPKKVIYNTDTPEGKTATFFHNEHVALFGLECGECHSNESCVKCHDINAYKPGGKKSLEEHHVTCSSCHDTNTNCGKCHSDKEKSPFNHMAATGFDITKFHINLSCNKCHTVKGKFGGINNDCSSCHGEFTQENFDHKVTSLMLSKIHSEFECSDCHSKPDFTNPSCGSCHDEDIKYPDYVPGELIN